MAHLARFLAVFVLILIPATHFAQSVDPISDSARVIANGGREEIIGGDYENLIIYKYFKALEYAAHDTIVPVLAHCPSIAEGIPALGPVVAANFDNDPLPEIAGVWIPSGADSLVIALMKPDGASLSKPAIARWARTRQIGQSSPAPFNNGSGRSRPVIVRLAAGNFDADSVREMVLAYCANTGAGQPKVNLTLYDMGDSLMPIRRASIADLDLPVPPKELHTAEQIFYRQYFDITAGDFDGDGKQEILLVARVPVAPTGRALIGRIYSYDASIPQFTLRATDTLFTSRDSLYELGMIYATAGRLASTAHDDALVEFQLSSPTNDIDTVSVHIATLGIQETLDNLTMYQEACIYRGVMEVRYPELNAPSTGDIDGDGLAEVGCAIAPGILDRIYDVGPDHRCTVAAAFDPGAATLTARLGDFREDGISTEIIALGNYDYSTGGYVTHVHALQPGAGGFQRGPVLASGNVYSVLCSADLDGDMRLGPPKTFRMTQVVQPLVILNAPPIHFDAFGGTSYDVSKSYGANTAAFVSRYAKSSSTAREVDVEINSDWGQSWGVSSDFSFWGVSVKSHFTDTYGEKFSKKSEMSTKVAVAIATDAKEDDKIYAAVLDVDVWEYPILVNGQHRGDFLVVHPWPVENRWFPSKSWSGYSYVPSHEVGEILSYREYPDLAQNPAVAEQIKGDFSHSFSLDATSSYDWSLQFSDFGSQGTTSSWEHSMEWGASVNAWGFGMEVNGHYNKEVINTQKTDVSNGLDMSVHLDGLNMSVGEVGYIVVPYAYWSTNGALVIDYAVRPEISSGGGTPTWWQSRYGSKSDPTFILPWRLDPEKGYTLQDEAKRKQTKDIRVTPVNPIPGQTVTIQAFVHNFSLIETPQPVGVRFYLGDPDSGGALITGVGGVTEAYTHLAIPARGWDTVSMQWVLPQGLPTFQRIYAVIDPGNALDEVHENNNVGWAIFSPAGTNGIDDREAEPLPVAAGLDQNFPNPFNPTTTMRYRVPKAGQVRIVVYDIIGREVARLVDGYVPAGEFITHFDGSRVSSGMYFSRMEYNGTKLTRKMMMVK